MKKPQSVTLFISIPLPENTREKLVRFQKKYALVAGLRWTPKDALHTTLLYIGDVPEELYKNLWAALGRVAKQQRPFTLPYDKVVYAPPKDLAPNMIWLSWKEHELLTRLTKEVVDAVREVGITPENTYKRLWGAQYVPHTTLAKFGKSANFGPLPNLTELDLDIAGLPVDRFEIVASHVTQTGSRYIIIKTFTFKM